MRLKLIFATLITTMLIGCASNDKVSSIGTTTEYDSTGNVIRVTSQPIGEKSYAKLKSVEAAERSNQAYYLSEGKKYENLTDGRDIALVEAIGLLGKKRQPTNFNDTLVAESNASVAKTQAITGGIIGLGKTIAGVALGVKGFDTLDSVLSTAVDNAGTNTTNTSTTTLTDSTLADSAIGPNASATGAATASGGSVIADRSVTGDINPNSGNTTTTTDTVDESVDEPITILPPITVFPNGPL